MIKCFCVGFGKLHQRLTSPRCMLVCIHTHCGHHHELRVMASCWTSVTWAVEIFLSLQKKVVVDFFVWHTLFSHMMWRNNRWASCFRSTVGDYSSHFDAFCLKRALGITLGCIYKQLCIFGSIVIIIQCSFRIKMCAFTPHFPKANTKIAILVTEPISLLYCRQSTGQVYKPMASLWLMKNMDTSPSLKWKEFVWWPQIIGSNFREFLFFANFSMIMGDLIQFFQLPWKP